MAQVVRDQKILVSRHSLYRAITEFEKYPTFLPEVVSAKSTVDKNLTRVQFELEVVKRFQYVLEFQLVPEERVSWKLVESNFFKKNDGQWLLKEIGPTETQVHYELEVDFGFMVPGFISRKLTEVSLPGMFDNFQKQAIQLK